MLKEYPFFVKNTIVLFGLTLLVYALYNMREIVVPLAFALLLAILLNPLTNWFKRKKVKHGVAIAFSLIIAIIIISSIIFFLSMQIARFAEELPTLKKKFQILFSNFQAFMQSDLGLPISKQDNLLAEAQAGLKPFLGHTLGTLLGSLQVVFLLPVYTFLFLYYKTLILNFLFEIFSEKNSKDVNEILHQTKGAIQNYMIGLLAEALIVASLNFLLLWTLSVKYALLLAVLMALLNVLPYIGGIIGICLPLIIATLTKDGFDVQIWIIIGFMVIQFIDNNFLVPMIVSSKVRINAMVSIIIVLLGGAVWGISGMFLSIPFIGVLKLIFDRVPDLKPWGKLLGDEIPSKHKGEIWNKFRRRAALKMDQGK